MRTTPSVTEIVRLPRDASVTEVIAVLERDGVAILEEVVGPATLARLDADLTPHLDAAGAGSRSGDPVWEEFHGGRTRRIMGVTARSPEAAVELLLHPTLLAWADHALLPHCGSYQCAATQVIEIGPGEPAQYLHRDQSAWPWFNALLPGGPEVVVSALFALTDFTAANGATLVVPGSHRFPDGADAFDPARAVPAAMAAGSVLLFSGKTVHAGGANRTDRPRRGLHLSYALGWLRPEEAHQLAIPPDVVRTLPVRARELLGFTQYDPTPGEGGRLGLVDFEDPAPAFGGR